MQEEEGRRYLPAQTGIESIGEERQGGVLDDGSDTELLKKKNSTNSDYISSTEAKRKITFTKTEWKKKN